MTNLPHTQGGAGEAGAVELGGSAQAAPANPRYQVGAVGFGPVWEEQPSLRELYDQACASIVRAEFEIEELRAEVALLDQERAILSKRLDARAEIEGWRNKWQCAVDMAARAELERDEGRTLAQAGYAKAHRAEKMLRTAAAKADEWRMVAEHLADAFRGVPYDPYTVGGFNAQKCKEALAEYRRLKEASK
jgi:Asp-tRNA(Asn)/Glu-tRNA(Gln) amidotransferase A subunit family amidase